MRILYDSKKNEFKTPFGAVKRNEKFYISIKIPVSCGTKEVILRFENDISKNTYDFPLFLKRADRDYETYSGEVRLDETGLYFYFFNINTEGSRFDLFRYGYSDTNIGEGEKWQLTCYPEDFTVPESFKGRIVYQIFPDRFYAAPPEEDTEGKLEPYYIHENKDDIPDYLPDSNGKIQNCDFFGGNLKGIIKKLDYIKSLGTGIIYLNPIFKAYSNHRYDTCDYMKIDPLLGSEKDFEELCSEAHRRDMKVILDGVFSHTGSRSIYFDRTGEFGNGACSSEHSPYKSWYSKEGGDGDYKYWWGVETLPCVNELDPGYMDFIINSGDGVIAHWLKLGADGVRLDVADELPDGFIKALRRRVKEIKPESFVIGEVWEDASNKISYGCRRKYFSDGELDSVMNYCFRKAVAGYSTDSVSSLEFAEEIMTICGNYPEESVNSLMNILSTHDTPRILTVLSGAGRADMTKKEKAGFRLSIKERSFAKSRLYIAALLIYTLPGNASVYYGDEIGMEGFGDPFNRGYFKWGREDRSILDFFTELGKLKTSLISLQKGSINFTRCDDVMIFERTFRNETVCVIINKSRDEFPIPKGDVLLYGNACLKNRKIYIGENGFAVYKKKVLPSP